MLQGKAGLFCLVQPRGASKRQKTRLFVFLLKLIMTLFFLFSKAKNIYKVMLFALALMKYPSTESYCWIQHLVAMYY